MLPLKLYTGLTIAYGAIHHWHRDRSYYLPGLALFGTVCAPVLWPVFVFVVDDYVDWRRKLLHSQSQ